jgi:hypothetical protein
MHAEQIKAEGTGNHLDSKFLVPEPSWLAVTNTEAMVAFSATFSPRAALS